MEVSGQLHAPAAFPARERAPGTHWIGGCVDPRARKKYDYRWLWSRLANYVTMFRSHTSELNHNVTTTIKTSFLRAENNKLNNPMEQSHSWEADSRSVRKFRLLWNYEVRYRGQNSPPLNHILKQMNPVHILTPSFLKIHFNIIQGLASGFLTKMYAFLIPSMRTTYITNLIFLYFIALK
jgi:hypothetical protein